MRKISKSISLLPPHLPPHPGTNRDLGRTPRHWAGRSSSALPSPSRNFRCPTSSRHPYLSKCHSSPCGQVLRVLVMVRLPSLATQLKPKPKLKHLRMCVRWSNGTLCPQEQSRRVTVDLSRSPSARLVLRITGCHNPLYRCEISLADADTVV